MSKFFLLSRLNRERNEQHKQPQVSAWKKWLYSQRQVLNIVLCVCILGMGVYYLVSVNQAASRGFAVTKLENQTEKLRLENKKLELQISELSAMPQLKEASSKLNLVAVEKVEYLKGSAVALGE